MRLLGVVLVWAAILCLLGVFIMGRERSVGTESLNSETAREEPAFDASEYTLEVSMTFNPVPDPFALPGDAAAEAGLVLKQGGGVIYTLEPDTSPQGPITLNPPPGIGPGVTEYLVEASVPRRNADALHEQAVRLRLLRSGATMAEQTYWSGPGGNISGVFRVHLESPKEEAAHGG